MSIFLNLTSLRLEFFKLLLQLIYAVLIYFFLLRRTLPLFLLYFGLNFFDFGFFYNICLMQFSNLSLLFIYCFDILFCLLSQLFQFLFHSLNLLHGLLILVIFNCFILGLSYSVEGFLFLFESLKLLF